MALLSGNNNSTLDEQRTEERAAAAYRLLIPVSSPPSRLVGQLAIATYRTARMRHASRTERSTINFDGGMKSKRVEKRSHCAGKRTKHTRARITCGARFVHCSGRRRSGWSSLGWVSFNVANSSSLITGPARRLTKRSVIIGKRHATAVPAATTACSIAHPRRQIATSRPFISRVEQVLARSFNRFSMILHWTNCLRLGASEYGCCDNSCSIEE